MRVNPNQRLVALKTTRELRLSNAFLLRDGFELYPHGFDGICIDDVPFVRLNGGPVYASMIDLPYAAIRRCCHWDAEYSLFRSSENMPDVMCPDTVQFIRWVKEGRAIHRFLKTMYGDALWPLDEWYLEKMLVYLMKNGKTADWCKLLEFTERPDPTTELRVKRKN